MEPNTAKSVRISGPRPLIGYMQRDRVTHTQRAFPLHPGRDPATALGRRLERTPVARGILVNDRRRQMAGPVFHVDGQGRPVLRLQARGRGNVSEIRYPFNHDIGRAPFRIETVHPDFGRDRSHLFGGHDANLARISDLGALGVLRSHSAAGRSCQPAVIFPLQPGEADLHL